MQVERDILNGKIRPKINNEAKKYNQTVEFSDLRWGIDTTGMNEIETNIKIFNVCFDEIERCKPYFIIILGDRYGYVPEMTEDYKLIEYPGKSITHMEVQKGVFENTNERKNIFIYFRETDYTDMPEHEEHIYKEAVLAQKRLENLKTQLKKDYSDRIKTYQAKWNTDKNELIIDGFADMVYQDLWERLSEEFIATQAESPLDEQLKENDLLQRNNSSFTYIIGNKLNDETEKLISTNKPICYLGNEQTDKSIYVLNLIQSCKQHGVNVQCMFCGMNEFSSSVRNTAEMLLYGLTICEKKYNFKDNQSLSYNQILSRILELKPSFNSKIILFIDSVEQCNDIKKMVRFIEWIMHFLSEYATVILSCHDNNVFTALLPSDCLFKTIQYDEADARRILDEILKHNNKEIHNQLKDKIIEKGINPFWIKLIISRLLRLNKTDYENINKLSEENGRFSYLYALIDNSPKDTAEFSTQLITRVIHEIDGDEGKNGQIRTVLGFIAFSRNGLNQQQLEGLRAILDEPWTQLRFSEMLIYLNEFLCFHSNGTLNFIHNSVREQIKIFYDKEFFCRALAVYYNAETDKNKAARSEFIWYAYCGNWIEAFVPMVLKYLEKARGEDIIERGQESFNSIRNILLDGGADFLLRGLNCLDNTDEMKSYITVIMTMLMKDEHNDIIEINKASNLIFSLLSREELPKKFMSIAVLYHIEQLHLLGLSNIEFGNFQPLIDEAMKESDKLIAEKANGEYNKNYEESIEGAIYDKLDRMIRHEQYDEAEKMALGLLKRILEKNNAKDEDSLLLLSNLYTKLSYIYKEKREWNKSLDFRMRCLEIYENELNHLTNDILEPKLRQAISNIADIYEAWAMRTEEKGLWEKAKHWYEKWYRKAIVTLGTSVDDKDYRITALLIFGYGKANIFTGDTEEGFRLFSEAKKIMDSLIKTEINTVTISETLNDTVRHSLDGVVSLCRAAEYSKAFSLSDKIDEYIYLILENANNKEVLDSLYHYLERFFEEMNGVVNRLNEKNDVDNAFLLVKMLSSFTQCSIPILNARGWRNHVSYLQEVSRMNYNFKNYNAAIEAYRLLINHIDHYKLLDYFKQANDEPFLCDVLFSTYAKEIDCLVLLGRDEEALAYAANLSNKIAKAGEIIPRLNALKAHILLYNILKSLDHPSVQIIQIILNAALYAAKNAAEEQEYNTQLANDLTKLFNGRDETA